MTETAVPDDDASVTDELEQDSRVADAELGVAEELGWGIAVLAGLACGLHTHNWVLSLPFGAAAYWLVTLRYRRRAAAIEDRYFRAAKLGKYNFPRI